MNTICQSCGATVEIPYNMLGATITCQRCGARTVAQAAAGARPANTGYQITFSDFHRLLSDPDSSPSIVPLLREWFGYELEARDGSTRVSTRDGQEVNELTLHQRIQSDEAKQGTLYRTAMSLWR